MDIYISGETKPSAMAWALQAILLWQFGRNAGQVPVRRQERRALPEKTKFQDPAMAGKFPQNSHWEVIPQAICQALGGPGSV